VLRGVLGEQALLLPGIGLYAVLDYSVLQRQREIGIRIAVGAPATRVASIVVSAILAMVSGGAVCGMGLGLAAAEYAQSLFYEVKPTEADVFMGVLFTILGIAALAATAPVARAVRIDPMTVLKVE
jgi:ABC-type lipoprotein release transport system permease subunit